MRAFLANHHVPFWHFPILGIAFVKDQKYVNLDQSSQRQHPKEQKYVNLDQSNQRQPGSPLMCYVVRLKHGDELRKSLLAFVKNNNLKAAFVMSCVGSSTSSRIRLASATADNEANYVSIFFFHLGYQRIPCFLALRCI